MLASILLLAFALVAFAYFLNARRPSRSLLFVLVSWASAWLATELAGHLLVLNIVVGGLLVWAGALEHPIGWVGLALLLVVIAPGTVTLFRSRRSAEQIREALEDLGEAEDAPRYPRSHIAFPPLMLYRRGVRHERGVVYCRREGRPLKLDVYLPEERPPEPLPAVVQVHGGGWMFGTRKEQAIPLLNHLAVNGWAGFSIDYRLSPYATLPDHVIDVKQAIAWVRENAERYGVDPGFVAITGGSAGGHLSALAALTSDDRTLQPGFEDADTSVAAAVPFYGIYDFLDPDLPPVVRWLLQDVVVKARRRAHPEPFRAASPTHRVHAGAPPFLVIHGQADTLVPVRQARAFVEELRRESDNPVLYAEMRGAQHAFDLIPSLRTVPVVEGIERFLRTVRERGPMRDEAVEREFAGAMRDAG